jgi:hypothetical protein
VPRATPPAQVAKRQSERSEPRLRATTVAQERPTPKREPAERETAQALPKDTVASEAPSSNNLPPGTVAAPAGTKEGAVRILSVTDRRLDETKKSPKPVAADRKEPQRTTEEPKEDLRGWRPARPHEDPAETATQPREIER